MNKFFFYLKKLSSFIVKADKRAEEEKMKKVVQERIERAEEMKEISIRLRRRSVLLCSVIHRLYTH